MTETNSGTTLYVAMELSNKKWLLAFTNGVKLRMISIPARDEKRFLAEVERAKTKLGMSGEVRVICCYEAGRDGFWIYRWLTSQGHECLVVDPASIEVNRRARRAKTDRLDAESLVTMLRRYDLGEKRVWSVVHVPSAESEDHMRMGRTLKRLSRERARHITRIKSLLVLHGLAFMGNNPADWKEQLPLLKCRDGQPLRANLALEVELELERLSLAEEQIGKVEAMKREALANPVTEAHKKAAKLKTLKGIGEVSSWTLSHEFFSWRDFKNRREVAACAGLTPSPYNSGDSRVEQGISKAGNPRVRAVMIELSWIWLRYQPQSALSIWYQKRFGQGKKRMRRVGIVALARKLLIALWRYVEFGIVPEGAVIKG